MAFALAAALAGLSIDQRSGALTFLTGTVAVTALLAVIAALVLGGAQLLAAALLLLGFLQFVHVLLIGELNPWMLGIVSVGLLLVGELVQWSLDSRSRGRLAAGLHLSRAIGVLWLVVFGTGVVVIGLAAAVLPMEEGIPALVLAMVSAVALLGLISTIGRNQEPLGAPGVPPDQ